MVFSTFATPGDIPAGLHIDSPPSVSMSAVSKLASGAVSALKLHQLESQSAGAQHTLGGPSPTILSCFYKFKTVYCWGIYICGWKLVKLYHILFFEMGVGYASTSGCIREVNHFNNLMPRGWSLPQVVVALIGYLESVAIASAFSRANGYEINTTQELVAIGCSNIASFFVQAYPVTGSFSRTAVNSATGVATPTAGLITGGIVLISIQFLTPVMKLISKASLGAIIIVSVIQM